MSSDINAVFEYKHSVSDDEIDRQGHVNNVEFIRWMQNAAVAHSTDRGWSAARYEEAGCGWVARSHHIDYLHPARRADGVVVDTWVANFSKVTCTRRYRIRTDSGKLLATAATEWAFIDLQSHRPKRIPEQLLDDFPVVPDADGAEST